MTIHILGEGILAWFAVERRTDRYGAVFLNDVATNTRPVLLLPLGGLSGKLRAVILDTRISAHLGDVAHQIFPSTPKKGEVIDLGVGELVLAECMAGVLPPTRRPTFWMNPWNLYKCIDQVVRLEFVEGDLDMPAWPSPSPTPDNELRLFRIPLGEEDPKN